MPRFPSLTLALAGSLALHGGTVLLLAAGATAGTPATRPARDAWIGDTFELDALLESGAPPGRFRAAPPRVGVEPSPARAESGSAARPRGEPTPVEPTPVSATPGAVAPRELRSALPAPTSRSPAPAGGDAAVPSPAGAAPAASALAGLTAEAPAGAGSVAGPGAQAYGATGDAAGERDLEPAFVRALPAAAASRTSDWAELRPGTELTARATLELDADGRLTAVVIAPGAPAPLAALLSRARYLLARGRFALPPGATVPTPPEYAVTARIDRRAPDPNPFADPGDIMRRGFAVATATHPAHAYFTFASGLHVEIEVARNERVGASASGRAGGG